MSRRYEIMIRQNKRRRKRRRIAAAVIAVLLLVVFVGSFFLICRASVPKQYITYTVQSGDTLWSIARDIYGDSCDIRYKIDDIERENGIMDARIYRGMRLLIEVDGHA